MSVFESKFAVDYHLLEPDLTARFPGLMSYIQETSIRHTESTAHKMQWYAENMRGWLLTNWHIEITRLPRWNDELTVRTWPSKFKGILADRSFAVTDAAGARLIAAMSSWVFTDIAEKRPIKPPQEILDGYGTVLPPVMEPQYKFNDRAGFAQISTREMTVTRRDTDTNYHVNNVRYIEWAFDDVPDAIYEHYTPSVLKVAYRRECKAGERLLLDCAVREGDSPALIVTVRKTAEPDVAVCEIYSEWVAKA